MEFRILGPLEVDGERGPLALGPIKPRAVLAVLLLHPNQPVTADRLALALWGKEAPADATRTVQVYVSRLRRALGDPEAIATTPAGYRLRVCPGELDAERFARGVQAGRRALAAGRPKDAGGLLRDALGLWRGPPLAELEFEPFAQVEIARLAEQRLAAMEARVEADLGAGRHAELVSELQQLLAEHPSRERLAADLMLALYRSGRQAEALAVYREAHRDLVQQAGIEPGPELQRLHEAILHQDSSLDLPAPPVGLPRELDADAATTLVGGDAPERAADRRSALPASPNRTIGREREIGWIAERLRAESVRLLTLTGPGGVGKTRLALEAGRAVGADFADGAHFVSLAAAKRPRDVPAAIVDALAIIPLAGEGAGQAVERFLAAKHALLVLDNCEHLLAAAPFIGGLPGACPAVTVLATSREPLAVHAEQCFPVPPLALPALETDPDAVARVDAVALFCERARAHDPGFELSAGDIGAVAKICRRVDGLPLGIELAAARCGLLTPPQIAERLHAALGALGTAARDAPARHRTLRVTIDWSHQLLDDDEQACFARFAVFAGGATVEAAETITGADIDTLDRLVAKSLLVRQQTHGRTRLEMLETIHAYAAERFAARAEPDAIRQRHYDYFLALAQRHAHQRAVCSASRNEHLARLDSEVDNVQAALEWAACQCEAERLLELSEGFGEYWLHRDRHADAVQWIEQALDAPGADRPSAVRVRALCLKAWALWPLGRRGEERATAAEAVTGARALGDTAVLSRALSDYAVQLAFDERLDLATPLADEALTCARASGDPWMIAMAAWARALAEGNAADLRERVEHAATRLTATGNAYHLATLYQVATHRALCNGSDRDALEYSDHAIPLVRKIGHPYLSMLHRGYAGAAALLNGDTDEAWRAFRESLTLGRELVVLPIAFDGLRGLAAVAALREDLDRAARLSGAATAHRYDEAFDAVDARIDAAFLEPARQRRGAHAWDAGVREGATLNFQDAIAYALEEPRSQSRIPTGDAPVPAGPNH